MFNFLSLHMITHLLLHLWTSAREPCQWRYMENKTSRTWRSASDFLGGNWIGWVMVLPVVLPFSGFLSLLLDSGCLVAQLCPTLCNPVDCSPPGSSVHGDSPGKNTGVGCHALLQGIFPTQGSKPVLPHCRKILYHLSHQGSPCRLGPCSLN